MVDLRLSPSGPVIAGIGGGFITRQWRTLLLAAGGSIDLEGLGEVGMGPGSPPVAPVFEVPVLAGMSYSGRLSTMFTSVNTGTNNLQVALQYSRDLGVTWLDMARNTMAVPGIIGDVQQAGLFRVDLTPDAILGETLLAPGVESQTLRFRGSLLWGGASELLWTTGTGFTSSQLRIQEQLND